MRSLGSTLTVRCNCIAMIAAIIIKLGMRNEQITTPNGALLIDLQIMSPKHLFLGMRSLVESQVRTDMISAIRVHTAVVYFGLGANRVRLNDLIVISRPKTKWTYPITKISVQFVSIAPPSFVWIYSRVNTICEDALQLTTNILFRAFACIDKNDVCCTNRKKPNSKGKDSAGWRFHRKSSFLSPVSLVFMQLRHI